MNYAAIATSPRRNWRFLTWWQQATFTPTASEEATRAITNRMGAKAPEFAK